MRRLVRMLFVLAAIVPLPSTVYAQASIAGVVRDASGAVLPRVAVAVSSPALIEKTRTTVSDGTGQYRIVDLKAGTYTVTFTLTGFSVSRHEGIELTGSFTATVNAGLTVGSVEVTVVVRAVSPMVDVQSARRQTTVSAEVLNTLPTARGYASIMQLVPGITLGAAGMDVQVTPVIVTFSGGGGRANEGRLLVDSLNVGVAFNGAGVSSYNVDVTNSLEASIITSGALGEAEIGGPSLNIVPKSGGNTFHGSLYAAGFNDRMVSSNYTQTLKDAGLSVPPTILKLWDFNAGAGGPIRKDRVWFFANYRDEGSYNNIPGMFANANFNNITTPVANAAAPWTYVPDTTKQARSAGSWTIGNARLTMQATPRNKVSLFWDEQHPCNGATWTPTGEGCRHPSGTDVYSFVVGGANTTSPEAAGYAHRFQRVQQATWTSTVTRRLLLEAGVGTYLNRWGTNRRPDSVTQDLVRVTEGCNTALGCAANGGIAGLVYRSEAPGDNWAGAHTWRASASFVTGAYQMKFGYQGAFHVDDQKNFPNSTSTSYTLQNGSAANAGSLITETLTPFQVHQRVRYDAWYAQEQWTIGKATLQGAVRYDDARSFFPDQQIGPVRFLPTAVVFAQDDPAFSTPNAANCGAVPAGFAGTCVNNVTGYHDITPRLGLAYDVFGTGKTSVKVTLDKYLEAASSANGNYTAGNPTVGRTVTSVTRTWTDANRNFQPDCVLENPAAQDTRASGGDLCGVISNQNFGKPIFTNSFDSNLMGGWGVRPSDWTFGVSVQQEIRPRTSVEIGYGRRWLNNFTVTDNVLQAPSDFTPFSIVAPLDARLPGGGGNTIGNLYNVNPLINGVANTTLINNYTTLASRYGNQYQHADGMLFNISSRLRNGLTWQGGVNGGKTVSDNCEIRANIPELSVGGGLVTASGPGVGPTAPYCHVDTGLVWRATALGMYIIPKLDVQVSGTFRSDQGGLLAANYSVPTGVVQSQGPQPLGRPLSNNAPLATVNLIVPGALYGDRINELDFKAARILRFGRTRTSVGVELYNALNSSAVLTYGQVFSPSVQSGPGAWLQPLSILTPRFVKFSAQVDF